MPQWIKDLMAEWPTIKAAPKSFAIVTIGPIVIFCLAALAMIDWHYAGIISGRDVEINILRDRIGAYEQKLKGKTPEQAADEISSLRDQLKEAKDSIARINNPPRDANSVYQNGQRVGVAMYPTIDSENRKVTFSQLTVGGELDMATNIEYRNLILSYVRADAVSMARQGLFGSSTYTNAVFSIVGNRTN